MNWKKYISVIPILMLLLVCAFACHAGNPPQTEGQEPAAEQTESETETEINSQSSADIRQPDSEKAPGGETMTKAHIGEFDFENHTVLLNSGYTMPDMHRFMYAGSGMSSNYSQAKMHLHF